MGRISHFSKLKSPSSHIFCQSLLHGLYSFNAIIFYDYCIYVFDPGGTKFWLLWALKNPLDLRTNPIQEGGDDTSTPRLIAWANCNVSTRN